VLWSIDNCHKGSVNAMCLSNNNKFICTGGDLGEVRIWEIRSKEMKINLKEHISKVTKVQVFSNDVHLLTSAKDRSILIWDLEKEKRIFSYNLTMGGCNNFCINPVDEQMMISTGQDRKITQWDLRQPKPLKSISSHPGNKVDLSDELFGLAWSHDGRYISTGGTLGIIRTWDANSLNFMGENYAHSKTCTSLSYTYDDKYLISCGTDAQILSFAIKN